ncbi:hypothetical protein [Daejeonia sp. YH14]|uniref:hypothetical protein n=1 Tax=Daejeonia sp. YH14 TaxID=3439042 RepID=UPI003F490EEC
MSNKGKIIGGVLAGAGIVTYLLCTKNGKKLVNDVSSEFPDRFRNTKETAEAKFEENREKLKENLANKVFDFAVNNRQSLASITSLILPYALKGFVKKKF